MTNDKRQIKELAKMSIKLISATMASTFNFICDNFDKFFRNPCFFYYFCTIYFRIVVSSLNPMDLQDTSFLNEPSVEDDAQQKGDSLLHPSSPLFAE